VIEYFAAARQIGAQSVSLSCRPIPRPIYLCGPCLKFKLVYIAIYVFEGGDFGHAILFVSLYTGAANYSKMRRPQRNYRFFPKSKNMVATAIFFRKIWRFFPNFIRIRPFTAYRNDTLMKSKLAVVAIYVEFWYRIVFLVSDSFPG